MLRVLTVDSFFTRAPKHIFSKSWQCWQLTVFLQEYPNTFFPKVESVDSWQYFLPKYSNILFRKLRVLTVSYMLRVLTVDSIFYESTQTYFLESWECWQYHICWECWELSKSWEFCRCWECWELSKSWECWQLTVFFTKVLKYIFTKVESVESLDEYR